MRKRSAATGKVPDPQRLFYLTDSDGEIAAYLESGFSGVELSGYLGKAVAVWGTMTYDPFADVRVMDVDRISLLKP